MAEYIERDNLEFPYMTMAKWGLNIETCHAYNEGVKAAADYIASVPAADVAPVVHGEWEYVDFVSPTIHCSVCKGLAPMDCCGDYHSERTDFCPHCGADMRLKEG